jgi:hypothetical protein
LFCFSKKNYLVMILNVIYPMIHYNHQFVHLMNVLLMKIHRMKTMRVQNIFHLDNIKYPEHHLDMIRIFKVQQLKILMTMMMKMFMIQINQHFFKKYKYKQPINQHNQQRIFHPIQLNQKEHNVMKVDDPSRKKWYPQFCF